MAQEQTQRPMTPIEINARIAALQAQRNMALDEVVAQAGEIARLNLLLQQYGKVTQNLQMKLNKYEPPAGDTKPCRGSEGLVFPGFVNLEQASLTSLAED